MIPGEEVALQHQLLVCNMMIDMLPQIKRKFTPPPKVWKLRDPQTCSRFQEVFKAHVPAVETDAATTTEEIWAKLKTGLLKTTEEVCSTTKPHRWRCETWWLLVGFVALRPKSTAMVIAGRSVHLITLFPGQA